MRGSKSTMQISTRFSFILLFVLCYGSSAFAQGFIDKLLGNKMQLYLCEGVEYPESCNSSCKKIDGATIDFIVNVDKSLVMMRTYKDGQPDGSESLAGCKVIDKLNWSCRTDFSGVDTMSNGIYSHRYRNTKNGRAVGLCTK